MRSRRRVQRVSGSARARAGVSAALLWSVVLLPGIAPDRFSVAWAQPPRSNTDDEIRIGRQVVEEVDRTVRLSDDSTSVRRLQKIADHLAPLTERPLIQYQIKIIEAPVANAFSIPGGFLYFTTTLLKDVRSDDELAAVVAHEIAHNTRQHTLNRMKRGTTQALRVAELISLGIFVFSGGGEWGQAAQLGIGALTQSVLSGYSIQDERDADERALWYMIWSDGNPVGFLTYMERQATIQNQQLEEQMGFFRTHPFSGDRVIRARRFLEEMHVPLLRRLVNGAPRPVYGTALRGGQPAPAVLLAGDPLYFLGGAVPETTAIPTGPAGNIEALTWILDNEVPAESLAVHVSAEGGASLAAGTAVVELSAADAEANGMTPEALATTLRQRLEAVREREQRQVSLIYYLIGSEKERPAR